VFKDKIMQLVTIMLAFEKRLVLVLIRLVGILCNIVICQMVGSDK